MSHRDVVERGAPSVADDDPAFFRAVVARVGERCDGVTIARATWDPTRAAALRHRAPRTDAPERLGVGRALAALRCPAPPAMRRCVGALTAGLCGPAPAAGYPAHVVLPWSAGSPSA